MRVSPLALAVHILLVLAVAQSACPQDAKPLACEDEKQVQEMTAACAALVEKAEGKPFPKPPEVRIVSRAEVTNILREEIAPQIKALLSAQSPLVVAATLDKTVAAYSHASLCKYAFVEKAIVVVPENFRSLSQLINNPKLLDPQLLRALLLHELMHAHDDLEADIGTLVRGPDNEVKLDVLNALVEGHAQFVARAILAEEGQSEWFDEMRRSILAFPPDLDEWSVSPSRAMGGRFMFAYEDGLRFFEQLEKAGKLPEFAKLVKHPPQSRSAIVNIGEYLGTANAPAPTHDLPAMVASLAERYRAPDYHVVSRAISTIDLRSTLTGAGPDDFAAILPSFRGGWVFVASSMDGHRITCAIVELAEEEGAKRFMGLEDKVSKARDEAFKTGPYLIKSATYDRVTTQGIDEGFWAEKKLEVAARDILVRTTVGRAGNLVVNLTWQSMPIERVDQEAWLASLLGAGKPPEADPRESQRILVGHEAHALASVKEIRDTEGTWAITDADGNGAKDYWTLDVAGFYAHPDKSGEKLKWIAIGDAKADVKGGGRYPAVGNAQPARGYWFGALKNDETAAPYCQDADGDGKRETNPEKYGFRAWPAEYGKGGKMTFILNEEGVVYAKDLGVGGNCDAWPGEDPAKAGWVEADSVVAAEMKAAGVDARKPPNPDRACVDNLSEFGSYIWFWMCKFGNDRVYPGPGTKLFGDLLGRPDRKRGVLRGREALLVCPFCGDDDALEKVKGGDYEAGGYEVTELVITDATTHPEDPIVWDKKAAHAGKRNVLLFSGSVVQMTDEELETARKKAKR